MPESDEILFEVKDGVGLLTLNRPKQRNALSIDMRERGMPGLIERAANDAAIRALVVTGAGGAFCAGADVKRMGVTSDADLTDRSQSLRQTLAWIYALAALPKPVIAAVDGVAYGGGFSLALTADFILASARARFCMVFNRIGLAPDMGGGYLLPRRVGLTRAKELCLTGRSVGAEEARTLGIALSVHEPADLLSAALAMAQRLARGPAVAQAQTKRMLNASLDSDVAGMIEVEIQAQEHCRPTDFHLEAVRRFAHKEPPLYDWDRMDAETAARDAAE